MSARLCAWCRGPIPPRARRDAVYCSQSHRQAAHRFKRDASHRDPSDGTPTRPLRLAYADPPYPGLADYYRDHPDYAGEVDHRALLVELAAGGFDGWALSTSSRALPFVLGLVAELGLEVRVAAWFRGPRGRARARRPLQSWEPVVYAGGREGGRIRLDALVHHARPRRTDPGQIIGAKPATFARWLFDLLGAEAGDELVDLFPGSGGIGRAWLAYTSTVARADASSGPSANASVAPSSSDASPEYSGDASSTTSSDASGASASDASAAAHLDASPRAAHDGWSALTDAEWLAFADALGIDTGDEAGR